MTKYIVEDVDIEDAAAGGRHWLETIAAQGETDEQKVRKTNCADSRVFDFSIGI